MLEAAVLKMPRAAPRSAAGNVFFFSFSFFFVCCSLFLGECFSCPVRRSGTLLNRKQTSGERALVSCLLALHQVHCDPGVVLSRTFLYCCFRVGRHAVVVLCWRLVTARDGQKQTLLPKQTSTFWKAALLRLIWRPAVAKTFSWRKVRGKFGKWVTQPRMTFQYQSDKSLVASSFSLARHDFRLEEKQVFRMMCLKH